jgi:molecular chaperone HscA
MGKVIGIDLGTTNSCVAIMEGGKPRVIENSEGDRTTPSVIAFSKDGEVLVGQPAKRQAVTNPANTLFAIKRLIGRKFDDEIVQRDIKMVPYKIVKADNGDAWVEVQGKKMAPQEISARVLMKMKKTAEDYLGEPVTEAVITVPAYFNDSQRQATKDAGRIAGLEVKRIINEPTAASLAYGEDKQGKDRKIAVYDLGGGTFDVTILLLEDGVFQVKSTGGDSALGGDDMDREIAERMLTAMGATTPQTRTPEVVSIALEAARRAKHALTDAAEVSIELPKKGGGELLFALTRRDFDAWIQPLLERTGKSCRRALRDAGLEAEALHGVILVGGSTRVPRVRSYVQELFGKEPLADIDPDLVVAYGAAIQADLLSRSSDEVLLLDVLPLSLGIETMGGGVDKILPRNTGIPAGAKATFTTYADNQTGFDLHVVQGEREIASDCRSLARFKLSGIPPLPAGFARLEVNFNVDENNLLSVKALELTTGITQSVEVKPSYGLTDEEVEQMLIDALDHGESDFELRRLRDAQVEATRILLATDKAFASDADLLEAPERTRIELALDELRQAASSASQASVVENAISALDDATHEWAGRRMNRAIQSAIAGKNLGTVEQSVAHAAGVEAHLAQHGERQPR